tara:strand:+ start:40731 stop:42284 length:1554 start_codon:yes stop_codon:yes gene_type:complete
MSATEQTTFRLDYTPIPRHAGLLKAATVLATLMQVLDMTITNVALPHMQAALGASQDSISWVLTSYIIASAIAIPITGWLSNRIGRRRLYLWSVGGFIITSVLCGLAANIEQMVLFRLLQGITGAFLTPLAQTVLLDSTPPEKRGQAMAMFGMGVVLGPVMGPILGGVLTESMNWRWVFFVNIPIGALAFAGLWFLLPDVKRPARSLDLTGFALLAISLASFQLMLDRGEHADWFNSAEIWLEFLVSASSFWMFCVHIITTKNPLYSRTMLGNRNLLVGTVLMAALGMIMTAAMALLPIMLQGLFGYSVLDAGLLLATRGVGVLVMMGLTGRLAAKIDPRFLIFFGFAIVSFSFYEMTQWNLDVDWTTMSINGFIQGLGLGMLFVPITTMAFSTLSAHDRTDASGLLNLSRSIGASVGISLVVTMLARNTATSHADLITHLTPYRLWLDPYMLALSGDGVKTGLAMLNAEVMRQASMIGFLDDFYFMMWLALCAIPLALLVKRSPRTEDEPIVEIME